MRSITTDEAEFNDYIKLFGNYKKITIDDFDYDEEVKWLFDYYFVRLDMSEYEDNKYSPEYGKFAKRLSLHFELKYQNEKQDMIDTRFNTPKQYNKNQTYYESISNGYSIQELFKIDKLTLAMSIYDREDYYRSDYIHPLERKHKERLINKFNPKKIREVDIGRFNNRMTLQKIEEWHQYCLSINEAKVFIQKMYYTWNGKKHTEFKEFTKQFQILKSCVFMNMAFEDISKKHRSLNKFQEYKAEMLLYYKLPRIDTIKIAREITKNLISPYK